MNYRILHAAFLLYIIFYYLNAFNFIRKVNCIRVNTWLPAGSPVPSQYPLEPSRRFVTFPLPLPFLKVVASDWPCYG
jgi:hypothetical protein